MPDPGSRFGAAAGCGDDEPELLHFTEYDTRLAGYAAIVEQRDGVAHLLLTWYNGTGRGEACWSLPGGGVEFTETIEQAIIREAHEETGYSIDLDGLLLVSTASVDDGGRGRPFRAVRVIHRAHVIGGTLGTVEQDGTTDFARWMPLDAIRREPAVASTVRAVLDSLGA